VEGLLGRFVDASYAFRFGAPAVGRITAHVGGAPPADFTATP
jgi:hypothetical protein